MTEKEIEIYKWIDQCPENCFSYKDRDNYIVIEIKLEEDDE